MMVRRVREGCLRNDFKLRLGGGVCQRYEEEMHLSR